MIQSGFENLWQDKVNGKFTQLSVGTHHLISPMHMCTSQIMPVSLAEAGTGHNKTGHWYELPID